MSALDTVKYTSLNINLYLLFRGLNDVESGFILLLDRIFVHLYRKPPFQIQQSYLWLLKKKNQNHKCLISMVCAETSIFSFSKKFYTNRLLPKYHNCNWIHIVTWPFMHIQENTGSKLKTWLQKIFLLLLPKYRQSKILSDSVQYHTPYVNLEWTSTWNSTSLCLPIL